ncbi:MAG: sensor domain-containing diguanylate cyclase [Candidatus Omnitrophica bacterium]|nr:sensor domain-containing diguanylate cyclase [Candidatus Omnitrophota bacterium]
MRKFFNNKNTFFLASQDLEESINIARDAKIQEVRLKTALQEKIRRYHSIKKIIEEVNRSLDLDSVALHLTNISFSVIAKEKGTCILYLADSLSHSLALFKTRKEDKKLVIKAKEGDIFDIWVLRHSSPLLVEDIRKDFRFDVEKLLSQRERPIASIISAGLISENSFLGILRLDNPVPGFYTQEDLRFLVTLCDLGAVALENSELFQRTKELAIHDGLTQAFNKGYFAQRLKDELKRNIRRNTELSLLMLDIDHFKQYNDTFGHAAGDIVLKELYNQMNDGLKDLSPILSRFGGEEFSVILSGVNRERAYQAAQALCRRVEKARISLRRQELGITVSIGVASFPRDASDTDELILKADRALYEAKRQGRNRAVCAGS